MKWTKSLAEMRKNRPFRSSYQGKLTARGGERKMGGPGVVRRCISGFEDGDTLQGTNISHLGKRKIIFKSALVGDMLVPRRVFQPAMLVYQRVK